MSVGDVVMKRIPIAVWDDDYQEIAAQAKTRGVGITDYVSSQCCSPLMTAELVEMVKAWSLIHGEDPALFISRTLFAAMKLPGVPEPIPADPPTATHGSDNESSVEARA